MKYAVLSDSHDNIYNLERAIEIIEKQEITTCFHLGDYCNPGVVRSMVAHQNIKWVCIWGNVDGAKAAILLDQKNNSNFDITSETFRELELTEGKVFLTHFPHIAQLAARVGEYRAVFHGHNHLKKAEKLEDGTLLSNPGEICGLKTGQPSFGIWDAKTNEIEIVDLSDFRIAK